MLLDPIFQDIGPTDALILNAISSGNQRATSYTRLRRGVYTCGHWNFDMYMERRDGKRLPFEMRYPSFPGDYDDDTYLGSYGVCDTVDQFLQYAGGRLHVPDRFFVVSLVEIRREHQPSNGGWRYHKWGQYIGTQNPQNEYLYDDKHIDAVFTFSILEAYEDQFWPEAHSTLVDKVVGGTATAFQIGTMTPG